MLCWVIRFVPYEVNEDDDYTSYENMAVFIISMYQYVTLAIIFSKGRPYRKTIFTNCESATSYYPWNICRERKLRDKNTCKPEWPYIYYAIFQRLNNITLSYLIYMDSTCLMHESALHNSKKCNLLQLSLIINTVSAGVYMQFSSNIKGTH